MSVLLTCPEGHQWEVDERRGSADTCPVCGAAGETVIQDDTSIPAAGDVNDLPPLPDPPPAARPAPEQELPETFGRYQILKPLGRGGMGSVYLAHDRQLDRQVALKVPRFRDGDVTLRERFQRESSRGGDVGSPQHLLGVRCRRA